MPELTTGNFMALQRKEIQFHPTETDTSSHIQETLTSHRSNPTHREKTPQLRETMTFQPAERAYKHSNLNKMKRQRNIQQVKENDKDMGIFLFKCNGHTTLYSPQMYHTVTQRVYITTASVVDICHQRVVTEFFPLKGELLRYALFKTFRHTAQY